ncbi:MAG: acetyl/propionyl/methylcrotonyl-CoA carboxylase subunit alpha [Acidimicrobiia bacterium]
MIRKLLVANRGEIARRIFRTCERMGIATVAVHSTPDADLPHAHEADEAVLLEGDTSADTYLNIDAVLAAAKKTGAHALHPGYGFLSENRDFARAVIDAGLIWIGPPPAAIAAMGSKLEAKHIAIAAGVPIIPSVELDGKAAEEAANRIGFPLLVKASAGGGGKGMRIVDSAENLAEAIEGARREAEASFGDPTVFLEKYLDGPRHIEIQVFADTHGNVYSLFERECSIQRRHQKIIEESPSPAIDEATRQAMGEAATKVASAVGYEGAGTVEFLFYEGEFFFLEMNTRLQVEHPVTEMVTGLDLVQLQIEVAAGRLLELEDLRIEGHAVEVRLYAEDPLNDYLPASGRFHRFRFPERDGLRVDSGIDDDSEVSVHYDPMIAKVIAHSTTRDSAISLLADALREARIHGSVTNRSLLVRVLEHPEFIAGDIDVGFLDRHPATELGAPLLDLRGERLAAVAAAIADQAAERAASPVLTTVPSGWRNLPTLPQHRAYRGEQGQHDISYTLRPGGFEVEGVGQLEVVDAEPASATLLVDGLEHRIEVARYGGERFVDSPQGPAHLVEVPRFPTTEMEEDEGSLHAPMPGKVVRVEVGEGDEVEEGDTLVILEAMKMEHTLRAPHSGAVTEVRCTPGDQVDANQVLVVVA